MAGTTEQRRRPKPPGLLNRLARAEGQLKEHPEAENPRFKETEMAVELDEGLEDETWESESLPDSDPDPDTAAPVEEPTQHDAFALSYRPVTEEDEDRLWDWIRADEDRGLRFLGLVPVTSMSMRERLGLFGADLVAIEEGGAHIGFGGFNPVTAIYVNLHLYLASRVRGRLPEFAPAFITESQRRYPGCKLTVVASEAAEVRLYTSFGFTVKHILTLDPPTLAETV